MRGHTLDANCDTVQDLYYTWTDNRSQQTLFFHKSTGVTNNINDDSILFKCYSEPWQCEEPACTASYTRTLKLKQPNWTQSSINFIIYPCAFQTAACLKAWKWSGIIQFSRKVFYSHCNCRLAKRHFVIAAAVKKYMTVAQLMLCALTIAARCHLNLFLSEN